MTEDELQSAISRGMKARELLENDLLKEAFANYEADCITKLLTTGPLDGEIREKLYLAINVARKVKQHLTKLVGGGKLAQTELRMRFPETQR
jgi:hypothetical protein